MLPKITATITIVETNDTTSHTFENVVEFAESLLINLILAETVFQRALQMNPPVVDGDNMTVTASFVDTGQVYMTAAATRHNYH